MLPGVSQPTEAAHERGVLGLGRGLAEQPADSLPEAGLAVAELVECTADLDGGVAEAGAGELQGHVVADGERAGGHASSVGAATDTLLVTSTTPGVPQHVWVAPVAQRPHETFPGLLLEWRQGDGGWEALVVWVIGGGNIAWHERQRWLPAAQVHAFDDHPSQRGQG